MDLTPVAAAVAVATPPFLLAYNHPDAYAKVQPWVSFVIRIFESALAGGIGVGWYMADSVKEPAETHRALVAMVPPWWWFFVLGGLELFLLALLGMRLLDITRREPK